MSKETEQVLNVLAWAGLCWWLQSDHGAWEAWSRLLGWWHRRGR